MYLDKSIMQAVFLIDNKTLRWKGNGPFYQELFLLIDLVHLILLIEEWVLEMFIRKWLKDDLWSGYEVTP